MAIATQAERAAQDATLVKVWNGGGQANLSDVDAKAARTLIDGGYLTSVGGRRVALTRLGRLVVKTLDGAD